MLNMNCPATMHARRDTTQTVSRFVIDKDLLLAVHPTTRRHTPHNLICLALLLGACLLPAACSYTARIHPPPIAEPIVVKLPLTVGVYIGEEFRRYELEEKVVTDKVRYPVGSAAIPWFEHAFAGTFARVVRLETWPTAASDIQLDAVIELRLLDFSKRFAERISISLEVVISKPDGREILCWPITGSYSLDTEMRQLTTRERLALVGKSFQVEALVGKQMASAMRQAATEFLLHFRDQESVHQWLEEEGFFRPILPDPAGLLHVEFSSPPKCAPAVFIAGDRSSCGSELTKELSSPPDPLTVLSPAEARDAFYPWLEPEADFSTARFLQIAQTERGAAELRRTALRYLVLLSSEKNETKGGGIWCGGGAFGAGGCFGVMWRDSKDTLTAAVSDLQKGVIETRAMEARAGYFIPALVLPIPILWSTKSEACTELARAVRAYINSLK